MKFVKFVAYLLYRYYSRRANAIVGTQFALAGMIFAHVVQIVYGFKLYRSFPFFRDDDSGSIFLKIMGAFLLIVAGVALLIKESELMYAEYDQAKIRRGNRWLLTYAIASFVLTMILILSDAAHSPRTALSFTYPDLLTGTAAPDCRMQRWLSFS